MSDRLPAGFSEAVLEGLSTGVLLVEPSGEIVYLNPAAEGLIGLSVKQAQGRSLGELMGAPPGDIEGVLERCAEAEQPYTRRELPIRPPHNDSGPLIVDCAITPVERGPQLVVELRDATRRVRISEENRLLTQHGGSRTMIRQLAHEVKNPLGGLRGAAQLLERRLDDAELKEFTGIIIKEADRLVTLVDDLLGPGTPPRKTDVNIHELLHHVHQLMSVDAPGAVVFRHDYDPSLPPIRLDWDQLVQALLNLVRNAIQALEDQGTIVFRTRALTHYTIGKSLHRLVACIDVEDDGPGVSEDLKDTLFYPLVTGRDHGTGLGLALAQELVNRHGGLIEFDSNPGRTVFRVLLPMNEARDG